MPLLRRATFPDHLFHGLAIRRAEGQVAHKAKAGGSLMSSQLPEVVGLVQVPTHGSHPSRRLI